MSANIADFVNARYQPNNMSIQYPRNMKRHEIITFFQHMSVRQEKFTASDVFRFKQVLRQKVMVKPTYSKLKHGETLQRGRRTLQPPRRESASSIDMEGLLRMSHTPQPDSTAMPTPTPTTGPVRPTEVESATGTTGIRPCTPAPMPMPTSPTGLVGTEMERTPSTSVLRAFTPTPMPMPMPMPMSTMSANAAFVFVGHDELENLRRRGVVIPPPCNGPNEGNPQYAILARDYNNAQIDPLLMPSG